MTFHQQIPALSPDIYIANSRSGSENTNTTSRRAEHQQCGPSPFFPSTRHCCLTDLSALAGQLSAALADEGVQIPRKGVQDQSCHRKVCSFKRFTLLVLSISLLLWSLIQKQVFLYEITLTALLGSVQVLYIKPWIWKYKKQSQGGIAVLSSAGSFLTHGRHY